jgi:hypothetical protein
MSFFRTVTRKSSSLSLGSSSDTSDGPPTPSQSILAHSTITKMLSLIRRGRTFSDGGSPTDDSRRRQLRLLTAASSVLVREFEVIAVVAKSSNTSVKIEVIVSTHLMSNNRRPPTPQKSSLSDSVWSLFASTNTCTDGLMDSLRFNGPYPDIINPQPPNAQFHDMTWLENYIEGGL